MKKVFAILTVSIFFIYSGICLAGSPKGLEKKGKVPKGFSQGEKAGWDGEYPKGWDKFTEEEKEEWLLKHGHKKNDEGKTKKNKHKKNKKSKEGKNKKK